MAFCFIIKFAKYIYEVITKVKYIKWLCKAIYHYYVYWINSSLDLVIINCIDTDEFSFVGIKILIMLIKFKKNLRHNHRDE